MFLSSKYFQFKIALLVASVVNLSKLILLFSAKNPAFIEQNSWSDWLLQYLFSLIFGGLILWLNEQKFQSKILKILVFFLVLIASSVFFIQIHQHIFNASEPIRGLRMGYFSRNFLTLVFSILIANFIKTNQEKNELALKNQKLVSEQLQSQLLGLQQQLNPHFLFNSLNSLQSLIRFEPQKSEVFVQNLASILRYTLDFQHEKLVNFEKEKQFLDAYLYLLKIRFGDKFDVNFSNLDQINGFLPPLSLQILIENVVNHNEISTNKPILVHINYDAQNQKLSIKNNLNPKRNPTNGTGIGLSNLNERYEILHGKGIEINQNNADFEVIIPILTKNQ
jgi:two-component system, LytTR family, sensor kinase